MATIQDIWDAAKRKDPYFFCRGICCPEDSLEPCDECKRGHD